jgi:hypothetical protein
MQNQERERLQNLLKRVSKPQTFQVLERASKHCESIVRQAATVIDEFAENNQLDFAGMCFVAVGSVGRDEALQSSDLDFIPVASSAASLSAYEKYDQKLRAYIGEKLSIKVSAGSDLTAPTTINDLTSAECIGGERDSSGSLTKRILILTEAIQIYGTLSIFEVRKKLLEAYTSSPRTSGPHVLALCNDVARYFRTLCVEYKAKIDDENKDWGTRNLKLRHSRKLWYFSLIIGVSALVQQFPGGRLNYKEAVLDALGYPPILRLLRSLPSDEHSARVGGILDHYAWFLLFMESNENRLRLANVAHEHRFDLSSNNPFPHLKLNSDLMHDAMIKLIDSLPSTVREKVFAWFLL